ncbi:PrgI family protein [Candidatus Uhrbacteria bacterium]|nr:PrgI family protein [Candidatus Uhrbacteria bacterium]
MQQFTVPQFISAEDKIMGNITVRQFVTMLGGGFALVLFYKIFNTPVFVIAAILDVVTIALFAFFKPNGRPFHFFVLSFFQTFKRPALRVWNKEVSLADIRAITKAEAKAGTTAAPPFVKPALTTSRLASISLMVDTGGVYEEERSQ